MGKKEKAHRAKVAKRNNQRTQDRETVKRVILQDIKDKGFSSVDEVLEKAPWYFSEIFPDTPPEVIKAALK